MSEVKSDTQKLHAPASVSVTTTPCKPEDDSLRAYIKTKYIETLLKDVSIFHNILAMFSTWILLAGFLVLPSTFEILRELPINSTVFKKVLSDVQHLPLLGVGFTCCTIGGIGMCFLWWRQRAAYTWLVSSIFVPGWLSGIGGLISTFVSIYTHNKGVYGASSIAAVAVTGGTTVICGFLAALYSFLLFRLKKVHDQEQKQKEMGSEAGTESGTEKESR